MSLDKRAIQLFKTLSNTDDYISSAFVCQALDIRPRTLRDLISKNQSYFKEAAGIVIDSKPNAGYRIKIVSEEKYYQFLKDQFQNEAQNQYLIPGDQDERVNYLVRLLLTAEDYVKIDAVADQIFVSRSTLNADLKQVRKKLGEYRIEIESKPHYGIRIIGEELAIRACIAKYYFYMGRYDHEYITKYHMDYFNYDMMESVKEIIYQIISENDFRLTDFGFKNLTIHILIALTRAHDQSGIELVIAQQQDLVETKEYQLALQIVEKIDFQYQIKLSENEVYYIAIHLLGKKNEEHLGPSDDDVEQLTHDILFSIKEMFGVDFTQDFDLYTMLLSHLPPMLHRIKYGLKTQNPLVSQIKIDYPLAYELSIHAGGMIYNHIHQEVSEDEIAYLTLHFALAIQKSEESYQKRVVVVCASGRGSSQLLLHKLKIQFPHSFKEIRSAQAYQLSELNLENYDFIVTTIDLEIESPIPVIKIQYFLSDDDLLHIQQVIVNKSNRTFIQQCFSPKLFIASLSATSKEDVLKKMILQLEKHVAIPQDFYQKMIEREAVSSTEFGHRVAMPHPIEPMTESTFIQVAVLEKPIRWDKKMVKFIFLLSVKENSDEALPFFNEVLAKYILNHALLDILEKNPNYETLMNSINTIITNEEGDESSIFK